MRLLCHALSNSQSRSIPDGANDVKEYGGQDERPRLAGPLRLLGSVLGGLLPDLSGRVLHAAVLAPALALLAAALAAEEPVEGPMELHRNALLRRSLDHRELETHRDPPFSSAVHRNNTRNFK